MFTGERLNEICKLKVSDICEEESIWYFAFCSYGEEVAKTKAAIRNVPIHKMLIKIAIKKSFPHFGTPSFIIFSKRVLMKNVSK
jgi:hypothetical protein